MTISILAYDEKTGLMGGAAATGSLCVGGWVLRGDAESGLSASQGTAPSTLWGDEVLGLMRRGQSAAQAVADVTGPDTGRAHRQLAALDPTGGTGAHTGEESVAYAGVQMGPGLVVAGNMLTGPDVIAAANAAYQRAADCPLGDRLLAALDGAAHAGGDARGLKSAALLVVSRNAPPLSLRIDHSDRPLAALGDLYRVAHAEPYFGWTKVVPVLDDPFRAPAPDDVPAVPEPIAAAAPAVKR